MGVAVTFIAILELVREGLINIVQQEPFAPIHVRAAAAGRKLRVVSNEFGTEEVLQAQLVPLADDTALDDPGAAFDDDDDDDDDDVVDPGVERQ